MSSTKGSIFDFKLFSKLMKFVSLYKRTYYFVLLSAILLSGFSIVAPYLLKIVVDDYISLGALFLLFFLYLTMDLLSYTSSLLISL